MKNLKFRHILFSLTFIIYSVHLFINKYEFSDIAMYIILLLLFTLFDVLGFHDVLTKEETIEIDKSSSPNISYRNIQIVFQILICFPLINAYFYSVLFFWISWWSGLCDWGYYIILKQRVKDDALMPWTQWTWLGILTTMDYSLLKIEATIFLIISLVLLILLNYNVIGV